jgi:hypothetical protein
MTRAEFLRLIAGASSWPIIDPVGTRLRAYQTATPPAIEARAARVIEAYDSQGIHRTATPVDDGSGAWLRELAADTGASATLESFSLERVDVQQAFVRSGDRQIEALPLFDGSFTSAVGITGRLGPAAKPQEVALVTLDQGAISSEGGSLAELRRSTAVKAIVAITQGARPGLTPSNAVSFAAPYGVPVVQVSSEHRAWLEEAAARGATVHVVAHVTRSKATASNVVANLPGTRPSLDPIVVMTPRSGWWQCAAERGGGIVCWLEAMRAVRSARASRPAIFVASSGHELGHLGLDAFIHRREALPKTAAWWMHFGANIGAAGGRARLQTSTETVAELAVAAMTRQGTEVAQRVPVGSRPAGEARNIHDAGGRYVSVLGNSPYFHSREDRWPSAVDVHVVGQFAAAFAELAVKLAAE